jgi:hypothetical protein
LHKICLVLQIDGISKAKKKGVQFRTKEKLTVEQITKLQQKRKGGVLIKNVINDYKLSKASVYCYLGRNIKICKSNKIHVRNAFTWRVFGRLYKLTNLRRRVASEHIAGGFIRKGVK